MSQNKSVQLVVCGVVDPALFILYDETGNVLGEKSVTLKWSEFQLFLSELTSFLDSCDRTTADVSVYYVVNGPSSFTGGRIITLTINTLMLVHGSKWVTLSLFEFWKFQGNTFPMAIEANKEEVVYQQSEDAELVLISKQSKELQEGRGVSTWAWNIWNLASEHYAIKYTHNTSKLWSSLVKLRYSTKIEPLYMKRPNITLSPARHGTN